MVIDSSVYLVLFSFKPLLNLNGSLKLTTSVVQRPKVRFATQEVAGFADSIPDSGLIFVRPAQIFVLRTPKCWPNIVKKVKKVICKIECRLRNDC